MKIPSIRTSNEEFSQSVISERVLKLAARLNSLPHSDEAIVLCTGQNALEDVLLILALIASGKKVAICSFKEPKGVLLAFLSKLNCKVAIGFADDVLDDLHALGIKTYSFSEINRHLCCRHCEPVRAWQSLVNKATQLLNLRLPRRFAARNDGEEERLLPQNFMAYLRTSGTTADPKIAKISYQAFMASAKSVCERFEFTKDSAWALTLPLHHVSGLSIIFRAISSGGAIYLLKEMAEISLKRFSHVSLVPTQLYRLLDVCDLSQMHAVVIGGDAISNDLQKKALDKNIKLYLTYGMTETASMILVNNEKLPHACLKISAEGELLVKGTSMFSGYVGRKDALDDDGFFKTGDLAHIDDTGAVQIIGRRSNRIICGGENIQCEEIERAMLNHPAVSETLVLGIADAEFGEVVAAFIKPYDHMPSEIELKNFLRLKLAPIKIPKIIIPWPDFAPEPARKNRRWFIEYTKKLSGISIK